MRLSRDLLTRGITYKLQERAYGGLSLATARKLEHANADPQSRGAAKPVQPISLRPGTRLVREWRGVTHMVLIHADGIEWRGQGALLGRGGRFQDPAVKMPGRMSEDRHSDSKPDEQQDEADHQARGDGCSPYRHGERIR
jgi:hypothetical protein